MSKTKYFRDIEVEETDDRFETVDAIRDDRNYVDHVRVSKKFEDGEVARAAIQAFRNSEDPHHSFGIQLTADPAKLRRVASALDQIAMELE